MKKVKEDDSCPNHRAHLEGVLRYYTAMMNLRPQSLVVAASLLVIISRPALGLDNGFRVPPMGWSSWYGFTSNIDEAMIKGIADGMVSSGLAAVGFRQIWIDDGYALPRDPTTGRITVDPKLFPSGFRNLSDYIHGKGLLFGIYTDIGDLTCLASQPGQPKRPGSCGHEMLDADTYANEWQVDAVKDDGCYNCPQHDPYIAMRDALNATGRHIFYNIHACASAGCPNATVGNSWRTGPDLYSSEFDMWTNRLDLATTPEQLALLAPGAFPDPDDLEVGYSPRCTPANSQSALEQRSMFTMWAVLPTQLLLSADLRAGSGGLDADALATLTNTEVIAINQDPAVLPIRLVSNTSDGFQVWRRSLADKNVIAVVFFFRGNSTSGPLPHPPPVQEMSVDWTALGYASDTKITIRDLWARTTLGTFAGSFAANVTQREAKIFTFTQQ